VPEPPHLATDSCEQADWEACILGQQDQAVPACVQPSNALAFSSGSLRELFRFPKHVRRLSKEQAAKFDERWAVWFLCAPNVEGHSL
jgi:hypothetical protein